MRAMLATLFLSQGVPMLLGGDEFGRSQRGNNNAYCQDNELTWFDWENIDDDTLAITKTLINLRKTHPVFRRRRFFDGHPGEGEDLADIGWFDPDGTPMTQADWELPTRRSLGVFLNGKAMVARGKKGEEISDDSFFVLMNAQAVPRNSQCQSRWMTCCGPSSLTPHNQKRRIGRLLVASRHKRGR